MKKVGLLLALGIFGLLFQQCQEKKESGTNNKEVSSTIDSTDVAHANTNKVTVATNLIGIYEGGYMWKEEGKKEEYVKGTILLQEGNKYVYTTTVENKDSVEKGEWEQEGDRLYLREDADSAAIGFVIRGNTLHMYDTEGEIVNNGETGDFIFKKL